jgi:glycerol-3-phosphate dehydrogenase
MAPRPSEGYQARTLWQETATPHPVSRAEPPTTVDLVVVGGGYCGLSAAAEAARRGRSVALLDAHDLGWGASSRNGGMVLP